MGQLAQYTQFTVPANPGLEINLGNVRGWLSIAVDTVAGQATGTGVTVTISGFKVYQIFQLAYGSPALTIPFTGNLLRVTGSGAVIELLADTDHVVVAPVVLTPGTVAVSGTVDTNLKEVAGTLQTGTPQIAGIQAAVGTSATTVQSILGVPMVAVSPQDPPQVAVSGGKALPVKTEV